MVFTGFAVNYMVRINLNIAIVSMVQPRSKNNQTLTSACIIQDLLGLANNSVSNVSYKGHFLSAHN